MKVTKSYIERLIKEELQKVLNEEYKPPSEKDFEFRITNGQGQVPGLKAGAQGVSIMVSNMPGRGPTPEHRQIFVLPRAVGTYDNIEDALMASRSGEAYYMTPEEIESLTMPDSVRPGQLSNNMSGMGYNEE